MDSWEIFATEVGLTSLKEFLQEYPHPFLVVDRFRFPETISDDATITHFDINESENQDEDPIGIYTVSSEKERHRTELMVGRSSDCDVSIREAGISKTHGRIRKNETGQWTFDDAGSKNGTYLNDRKLRPSVEEPVQSGDTITLGKGFIATFYSPEDLYDYISLWNRINDSERVRTPVQTWNFREFVIECFTREQHEFISTHSHPFLIQKDDYIWMSEGVSETWDLELAGVCEDLDDFDKTEERKVYHLPEETYKIGRKETDLTIHHSTISETHGAFSHLKNDGGAIADIGSTNGTYVNGMRVPAHTTVPLQDKDKVAFGAVTFTFMLAETAYSFGSFVAEKLGLTQDKAAKLTSGKTKSSPAPKTKKPSKPKESVPAPPKRLPDVPLHKKKEVPPLSRKTDRLPSQDGYRVRRHPAAQPMGHAPTMSSLMKQAVEDQFTRQKKGQSQGQAGKFVWVLANLPMLVAAIFMMIAWGYVIYVFLIKGAYSE